MSGDLSSPSGVLPVDKPAGLTSARAVDRIKRLLPRGTKVGHAGTLDPFATGLLLLLVGKATKLCERMMDQAKTYEATVKLGANTETDDPESPEAVSALSRGQIASIDRPAVDAALRRFVGEIQQVPPAYSALKIAGRRAADRVRAGQDVQMQPRTVKVYEVTLLRYEWPFAEIRVDCGRGTYIRAIARDLGAALGTGGYLTALRRTRIGKFDVADALRLDAADAAGVSERIRSAGN